MVSESGSLMPENGVIFSDGIEADYLGFTSGMEAKIGVAERVGDWWCECGGQTSIRS